MAEVVKKYPKQTRILLTSYTDSDAIIDAINRGQIFRFLTKPWDFDKLKKAVEDGYADYKKGIEEKETIKSLNIIIEELNEELRRKRGEE